MSKLIATTTAALAVCLGVGTSHATFKLIDENSSLSGDVTSDDFTDNFEVKNFVVDGADPLFSHSLSFNVAGGSTKFDVVTDRTGELNTDFDGSGKPDNLFATFADPDGRFNVEVNNRLEGGQPGSGVADLAQQIQVNNTSDSDLDFSLIYFANYDIAGDFAGDSALQVNENTLVQSDGAQFVETVFTPAADVDIQETTFMPNAVGSLNDDSTGDLSWTLQWDAEIASGGTFHVTLDTRTIIPEPGSSVLLLTGLFLTGRGLRRPAKG